MLHSPELVSEQYQTSVNLDARIQLHERFSTNQYDWMLWVFDQFDLPVTAQILEIGCGTGKLWQTSLHRIPAQWTITLSDQSAGMLEQARVNLDDQAARFRFAQFNTESIPLADASLDAVIANHMLYHVADLPKALGEIQRVLKPGGHLYAATNGEKHMQELRNLVRGFAPEAYAWREQMHFSLEDGAQWLAPYFTQIELRRFESDLLVTEVVPLVAYACSMGEIPAERQAEFTRYVEQRLQAQQGTLRIQKAGGIFCAVK